MPEVLDVVIAGGGPVGAALALGLSAADFRVALLDARRSAPNADTANAAEARTIALSHGSRLILERLGVWKELAPLATPIERINVSQQSGYGRAWLDAVQAQVPALGYVVTYSALQRTLDQSLTARHVEVVSNAVIESSTVADDTITLTFARSPGRLAARLLAIADGGHLANGAHARARDYGQSALVCNVSSEEAHQNRAFERFTPHGPLALLPHGQVWSLVWTTRSARAHELAAADNVTFCRRLQSAFGTSLGLFGAPSRRLVFPLALKVASAPVQPRTVLVGNAAQTLHPVAGQGFNLGLRDAWELTRTLSQRHRDDPGASRALKAYLSLRRFDRNATVLFTDSLIRLFCKDIPLLRALRSGGLTALSALPPAKNFLVRRMLFGARG